MAAWLSVDSNDNQCSKKLGLGGKRVDIIWNNLDINLQSTNVEVKLVDWVCELSVNKLVELGESRTIGKVS